MPPTAQPLHQLHNASSGGAQAMPAVPPSQLQAGAWAVVKQSFCKARRLSADSLLPQLLHTYEAAAAQTFPYVPGCDLSACNDVFISAPPKVSIKPFLQDRGGREQNLSLLAAGSPAPDWNICSCLQLISLLTRFSPCIVIFHFSLVQQRRTTHRKG